MLLESWNQPKYIFCYKLQTKHLNNQIRDVLNQRALNLNVVGISNRAINVTVTLEIGNLGVNCFITYNIIFS